MLRKLQNFYAGLRSAYNLHRHISSIFQAGRAHQHTSLLARSATRPVILCLDASINLDHLEIDAFRWIRF
jgi:hypothetical protein